MEKEKKYITQDNYEVLSDRIVFYPKKDNNEYRVCSDLANEVPDQVSIFVEKDKCEKHIQWLNEFGDVLHKQSDKPTFKTYDLVDVEVGQNVWSAFAGLNDWDSAIIDSPTLEQCRENLDLVKSFYYFSTPEACQKYIDSKRVSETPIEAPNAPNLATKTILEQIHPHEVDRLVFWEQYKLASTPIDKEIALLAMIQEDSHIITKLTQYVHNSTK